MASSTHPSNPPYPPPFPLPPSPTLSSRLQRPNRSRSLNCGLISNDHREGNGSFVNQPDTPNEGTELTNSADEPPRRSYIYSINRLHCAISTVVILMASLILGVDLGRIFNILSSLLVPCSAFLGLFVIVPLYLRNLWTDTSVFILFYACSIVDILGCHMDIVEIVKSVGVLLTACLASIFSSLDTGQSSVIICLVSFVRYLACSTLSVLPLGLRPLLVYLCAIAGVVLARHLETSFAEAALKEPSSATISQYGRAAIIKRRRSSTVVTNDFSSHLVGRRISLPTLMNKPNGATVSIDSMLLREAKGLLADIMVDPGLPQHLLNGLKAVSLIIKPIDNHGSGHKSKVSPLLSLSEVTMQGCELEFVELSHSEKFLHSYKKFRRSLPQSLIHYRSAMSSWTTTTSATGLPSLESEPLCRGKVASKSDGPHSKLTRRSFHVMTSNYDSSASPPGSEFGENGRDHCLRRAASDERRDTTPSEFKLSQYDDQSSGNKDDSDVKFSDDIQTNFMLPDSKDCLPDYEDCPHNTNLHVANVVEANPLWFCDEIQTSHLLDIETLNQWDYPIFEISALAPDTVLSRVVYKLFTEMGFVQRFDIPIHQMLNYFHALELGYFDKPYHNRIHAADVLQAVHYIATQPIPAFQCKVPDEDSEKQDVKKKFGYSMLFTDSAYGIMGANFPSLELMAMYTAAAMHDFQHPGRTNAFLVSTCSNLAMLYNDRSVLENHHVASAWGLLMSSPSYAWLVNLDNVSFKRFRYLVIEAILATDLKRHFELLAEFNAKVNDVEVGGIDWMSESDRLMVANMVIKMADINGPCKKCELHLSWTERICEEFYEQGEEEQKLGLQISPFMNRQNPQLAKLQESFINHLVAPLCNALADANLLPAIILADDDESFGNEASNRSRNTSDDDDTDSIETTTEFNVPRRRVSCCLVTNLIRNIEMWIRVIDKERAENDSAENKWAENELAENEFAENEGAEEDSEPTLLNATGMDGEQEMEPIREEDTTTPGKLEAAC